ncbi:hypothetical protein JRW51_01215 [Mycoplasma sp. SG1]|nr:hypothetical protein JRW51_01215 [Mycoplasma sp. SG1]
MIILAIEATCDDTSFAVLKDHKVISLTKKVQAIHQNYNGIIPELAARYHFKDYDQFLLQALQEAKISFFDLNFIAYSEKPGLPACLHICKSIAKSLSFILNIPLIPINHLSAHLFSSLIDNNKPQLFIEQTNLGLILSGGHTNIYLWKENKLKIIGETLDDAIGSVLIN